MIIIRIAAFPADFTNGQTKETLIKEGELPTHLPKSWENETVLLPGTRFVHIPQVNVPCPAAWLLFHKVLNLIPQLMSSHAQQSMSERKDCSQARQKIS